MAGIICSPPKAAPAGDTPSPWRARAKLTGPYELHPDTHILSARHRPDAELQRAGHADLVETQNGETYMVYLCGTTACATAAAARSVVRPPFRRWSGARTAGCARWTDRGLPTLETPATASLPRRGLNESDPNPKGKTTRASVRRALHVATTSTHLNCRSISSGCARRGRTRSSASPPVPDSCGSLAVRPLAASSASRSLRAVSSRIASARRRSSSSNRSISSRVAGLVCYYNSAKFHYLYLSHDESAGQASPRHVLLAGLTAGRRLHAAHRDSLPASPCICAWKWTIERLHVRLSCRRR